MEGFSPRGFIKIFVGKISSPMIELFFRKEIFCRWLRKERYLLLRTTNHFLKH